MAILTDIPFELDFAALSRELHVEPDTEDARELAELIEKARSVGKPKAVYKECYVQGRGDDTVTIGGFTFSSRALRTNLTGVERVFPYVATCGEELDGIALPAGDFIQQFWLDTIKETLLGFSTKYLNAALDRKYALGKTSAMSPGSGDVTVWPIEQQTHLFALLGDVKDRIGVELTDSFLMVPNKSLSGIRFPTEIAFRSCQLCHRQHCPSRAAPFDKALWDSIGDGIEPEA
ncbi:MAG: vitamin B12 dependent methionine synthase [Planctomycetota bacterium]|nr:vitamin B12 dependent methionine synthase [Planctomycetota bacterium]